MGVSTSDSQCIFFLLGNGYNNSRHYGRDGASYTSSQTVRTRTIHHSVLTLWDVSGAERPLIVADMPFGSCEGDKYEAMRNAQRLLKEGGADCVKIEGGRERANTSKG